MKQLLAFAIISLFIIACGNSSSENTAASSSSTTAQATADGPDGEKVYKQYCVTCHGLYGDMGASGAFNLQTSKLALEERINVITNGRAGTAMAGFKGILPDDKIKAVAQYIETLRQ